MKTYIILWYRGGRLASIERTDANLAELEQAFTLVLFQEDATGCRHYQVYGVKTAKKSPKRKTA